MSVPSRADDLRALEILHLREIEGLSYADIARRMRMTKGAVIGMVNRINKAADAVPCLCRRPENKAGGMPPRWWEGRSCT